MGLPLPFLLLKNKLASIEVRPTDHVTVNANDYSTLLIHVTRPSDLGPNFDLDFQFPASYGHVSHVQNIQQVCLLI